MNIKSHYILLTLAFLVFIFAISTYANEERELKYQEEPGNEQTELQNTGAENGLAKTTESSQSREEEGKNLYLAALKILRSLKPTPFSMSSSHVDDVIIVAARLITNSILSLFRLASPPQPETPKGQRILSDNLRAAVEMLERSGLELENDDALFLLGEMNFYGKYTHPRNYTTAHHYYSVLASRSGNATAQQILGFLHATGLGGVPRDQGKALLFHTFAGHAHDTAAEMTLGYRYMMGIGTPQKCEEAVWWYKRVADKAIAHYRSGPPGGRAVPVGVKIRLYDDQGGVYGFGASQESVYERAHRGNPDSAHATIEEVYEFYKYNSIIDGEYETQLLLASLLHTGTRTIPRDYKRALELLESIAKRYFPPPWSPPGTKGPIPINNAKSTSIAGQTAGLLGLMHWRGEGVPASNKMAYLWFTRGAELGNPTSFNALGVMYSTGVDDIVERDHERAMDFWKKAAEKENPEAYVNLGYEYLQSGDSQNINIAFKYFTLAATKKHLLAYYYLAEMHIEGIGVSPSCEFAVNWYKLVAERGDWLHSPFEAAWSGYINGDLGAAALQYLLAAERGYELAQANVAWLLDPMRSALRIPRWLASSPPPPALLDRAAELALVYWTRSANQGNVDARVKMGDYYFSGIGAPRDPEKAAACYQFAAELNSPIAMWNLGYMYENGVGTTQDFYLAKRWYDNSVSTNPDGALPVTLSLTKLHIRYLWHRLTGGAAATSESEWGFLGSKETGNGGKSSEDEKINQDSQIADDLGLDGSEVARPTPDDDTEAEDEQLEDLVRSWKRRKAEDMGSDDNRIGNDAENEEDEFGGRSRRRRDDEELDDDMIDDDVFETFLILVVIVVVGWLVYVRQFRFAGAAPGVQRVGADGGGAGGGMAG